MRLLEKGVANNPREWIYPFELGFVHYVGKKNLTRATFDFAQAARQPGAPEFCERFAAWSSVPRTPSGVTMKSSPTTAKLAASSRVPRIAQRSARAPVTDGRSDLPDEGGGAVGAGHRPS